MFFFFKLFKLSLRSLEWFNSNIEPFKVLNSMFFMIFLLFCVFLCF